MKYTGTLERSTLNFSTKADRAMLNKGRENRNENL
jgi:hypothetical protein